VVIRTKKVEFAVLWFVTVLKLTDWLPLGAVEFEELSTRSEPAVAVLAVQPLAAPSPVGCEVRVDELTEKPDGVVQVPLAVVQAVNEADLTTVAEGTVKVNA
jgi:hypothetical protein